LNMIPGLPLRSAPGYVLAAFSRRIHPISGLLCSLILLTNLYIISRHEHRNPLCWCRL